MFDAGWLRATAAASEAAIVDAQTCLMYCTSNKAALRRLVDGGAGGDAMPHLHGGACEHGVVQSRGL